MEKWKSRGKGTKAESVLPPTRRPAGPACLPVDKKKDRKWSFGGLLRRISSGPNHEVSSNDEDITYIPGHMLSKRSTKKPSKMKSKLGKIPQRVESAEPAAPATDAISYGSKDTLELIRSLKANIEQSQDSLCPCNDSVNSRSSEGSLDALGKASRINRMKARAQAKRDRLCGNSSSDDDSHRSSQSLGQFRSDDGTQSAQGSQRIDACSRRTRGARTERYIRRMYRDDVTSGSESKALEPINAPRSENHAASRFSSNSVDSSQWRTNDVARSFSQGGSTPSVDLQRDLVFERNLPTRPISQLSHEPRVPQRTAIGCQRDVNENETFEREKRTWPQHLPRASPTNGIYGSLRQPKVPPPEPPPRSSKSRVFSNVYGNAGFAFNGVGHEAQSPRRYLSPLGARNGRTYNSDNEILLSDHVAPVRLRYLWKNSDEVENRRETPAELEQPYYRGTGYCNSLDRPRRPNYSLATRRTRDYHEEQENYDPRPCYPEVVPPPSDFAARSTSSLPKGVQLFSRQRLSHRGDDASFAAPRSPNLGDKPLEDKIIPKLRKARAISSCQSPARTQEDDEAERKRSSKNLEDALSELEAIYNSLRLSDEDLLERAEQRSMDEYRDKASKTAVENSRRSSDASSNDRDDGRRDRSSGSSQQQENDTRMKDDMAYRRMNPKERPPSVNGQVSLSQISYLATSPNLSSRDGDYFEHRSRSQRGTPDLTRDDLLFRSISHANNTLKVIEPQPPFGIPLGPVTAATESDYLHIKPTKLSHTRSLYIPQSEPDVVSDDLAFRNLRKDAPRETPAGFNRNNGNSFVQTESTRESPFFLKNTVAPGANKKRAVRSMSADLYGIMGKERSKQNDWYNDYIQSTQKLRFVERDDVVVAPVADGENLNHRGFNALGSKFSHGLNTDESRDTFLGPTSHFDLDINGNRSKSTLQRKIQVYVPQEIAIAEAVDKCPKPSEAKLDGKPRDAMKRVGGGSDDSSPERCDSRLSSRSDAHADDNDEKTKTIESFTEQELTEYKQLCQDLEKLIKRTTESDAKENEEVKETARESSEENNSQSEFDELEKLLIDDYELPVSIIAALDEIVEATSTERDDDQSSSRSTGLGAESLSSDNFQSSPTKTVEKIAEDDASSASELGLVSSNTGSLTDSVSDKFNQLLREVNDVPYVEPTKTFNKYPIDEVDVAGNLREADRSIGEHQTESPKVSVVAGETRNTTADATYEEPEVKTEAIGPSSRQDEHPAKPDDSTWRALRPRKGSKRDADERKMERTEIGDVVKPTYRQGENVDDERACNDGFYAFKDTSKHTVRKLCHVTNRVTAYHIVLCSLFLTLLITMIVAQ